MIILLYFTQQPEAVTPEIVKRLKEKYSTLTPTLQKMVDEIIEEFSA